MRSIARSAHLVVAWLLVAGVVVQLARDAWLGRRSAAEVTTATT
jgi:hypothetical protein